MGQTPIAVFIYNRPLHTRETLKRLLLCEGIDQSPIYVFCDGPKSDAGREQVHLARAAAREVLGNQATFVEVDANQGLARSIIGGVSKLCREYGRVIVVEDDLLVSPSFVTFLKAMLDHFENEPRVMQVSGYNFPVPAFSGRTEALLFPIPSSWGWATWSRAWSHFEESPRDWERLKTDWELRNRFNLRNSFDYSGMLERQIEGKSDSWAIRWYWSMFKREGLVVFPPTTLVQNAGFDGSGTHGWRSARMVLSAEKFQTATVSFSPPLKVEVCAEDFKAVRKVIRKLGGGVLGAFKRWLRVRR